MNVGSVPSIVVAWVDKGFSSNVNSFSSNGNRTGRTFENNNDNQKTLHLRNAKTFNNRTNGFNNHTNGFDFGFRLPK